ncbi:DUF6470 family protein [Paenibacillus sp. GCM10027627]|uniref:DUF6470 family protein n=1 Tax=unclassified Paenibacillus TaxID=185978 RepID=UPI0036425DC0
MRLPQIQIHSTPARIGIESKLGHYKIDQKQADVRMKSVDAVVNINSEPAVVLIDQSKTWEALTGGKPLPFWNRIYNQSGKYVLDAINKTVQEYNQIGDILAEGTIAALAKQSLSEERPKLQVFGPASPNNVSFKAVLSDPEINVTRGYVDIEVRPNPPQIEYMRGHVKTYMAQRPSVEVTAPKFDKHW